MLIADVLHASETGVFSLLSASFFDRLYLTAFSISLASPSPAKGAIIMMASESGKRFGPSHQPPDDISAR